MESGLQFLLMGVFLDKILQYFKNAKIDYRKLVDFMVRDLPLLRVYYYNCLPYLSASPTDEELKRFSNKQKFFRTLNKLPNFTVREGKLAYRGTDKDTEDPIFEQKRVDVYLAVDLVMHSTKRLITHAALLTGDSDLIPAIEIAKSEGVHVALYYLDSKGLHAPKAHDELLEAVDERIALHEELIFEWKRVDDQKG